MPADGGGNRDATPMHVVMLPWLAFGHIVPFAQLARRLLASSSSVRVTFLTAAGNVPRVEAMLSSASSAGRVAVVPLRLPRVPGLPEDAASTADLSPDGAELLKVALDAARPQVAALLAELRPDAVLLDFVTPWACEDATALGVKSLHFSVFSAVANAYLAVPARCPDGARAGARPSARDLMFAPAGFPGSSPLAAVGVPAYQAADFTYVFTSFGGQPSAYDRVVASTRACDGIVVKTCAEMEGAYINYLAAQLRKPLLVAGPLVPDPPRDELDERWATWLSAFPDGAVVFASFGSETFLPPAAATELLLGLEATGRPFLAVLNSPDGAAAVVPPPGLAERMSGRGLLHTGWVQQQHILHHRSVGCYVTHAGFSSVVEGLVAGCRLVLLPMKVDQYLNAALFARELRVGVEVARRDEDGWFWRQDVRNAVAAAVADGGEGDARKWADFLTDDGVQGRFADEFVRQLTELVSAASS
ncbi:anthocyanidin-3-O-glucoside rhamnosyltransferase-like [Miscanthus floridulus]|uniref:anthocyanidin-3-O-glucoside rhamnosyltransferase-like n=1 Tax=Miscanthus floridulus TaxID=154761 RepID=UPI0034593BFF